MTPRRQLDSFLAKYTPEIERLARLAFDWMSNRFPGATVLVYDNYNALVMGFSPSEKASDAAFSIVLYPRWVTLFFLHGVTLPDPEKRLKGSGKQVRHIVLERMEVLEEPAVLRLIELAAAEAGLDSCEGKGKIVIRMVLEKQRPRRPRK